MKIKVGSLKRLNPTKTMDSKEIELRIKIEFFEGGVLIEKAETYSFEMAGAHLGSIARRYKELLSQRELDKVMAEEKKAEEFEG